MLRLGIQRKAIEIGTKMSSQSSDGLRRDDGDGLGEGSVEAVFIMRNEVVRVLDVALCGRIAMRRYDYGFTYFAVITKSMPPRML